jgi:RHS repeat-associated protein
MNVRISWSEVSHGRSFFIPRVSHRFSLFGIILLFSLLSDVTRPSSRAGEAVLVEAGSDYRIWKRPVETSDDGAALEGARSGKVVEIATGMNYWDGDQWRPSEPQLEVVANGFSASRMQHKVHLAENINQIGAVHIITRDGVELKSTPVAVVLYDAGSGRTLVIGTVTNSIGILVNATKVVYPSAFHGISADLVYTIDQSSFEQDVVITGALNVADYGFPPETTRIQILTEFYDAPRPDRVKRPVFIEKDPDRRKAMATPDFIDETLGFGEFVLGGGRAFQEDAKVTPVSAGAPVVKEFKEIEARTFLIESVAYSAIAGKRHASYVPRRPKLPGITAKIGSLPVPPKQLASGPANSQAVRRIADAGFPLPKGITIDYRATVNTTIASAKVFQGDTTYLVSGPVICNGSVTIEGGAVFKYKFISGAAPYIKATTSFTCNTATYRPAILTAVDDDSVGESMNGYPNSGYTGAINSLKYAGPALWLYNLSSVTANNLRIRYAQEGIRVEASPGAAANVLNAQFVSCIKGIVLTSGCSGTGWSGSGFVVNNCLFTGVTTPLGWNIQCWPTSAYNVTVDNANTGNLISPPPGGTPTIKFVNSIFANVSTLGMAANSISGGTNGFYNVTSANQFGTTGAASRIVLSSSPFQSRGAANYYLLDPSPLLRGKGVPLLSTLTAQIVNKTTYAPLDFANSITGSGLTIWNPFVSRDTAGKDLGYHYDPIDYLVNNMQVPANAQLTLSLSPSPTSGLVIATYGSSGLILKENATLSSEGTPYLHNHIVRYVVAQEQPVRLPLGAGTDPATYKSIDPANLTPGPIINCRFTDFEGMSGGGYHIYGTDSGTTISAMTLRDCGFNSAAALFGGPTSAMIALNNNSFESCMLEFRYTPEIVAYNNLFRRGGATIAKATSNNQWVFRDNIFDTITNTVSGDTLNLVHGKNGYFTTDPACPVTRLTPTQSSDILPNPFTYASPSTFGSFYQPPTSVFLDIGSRSAELAGLQHHTVLTGQTQEGPTGAVDIGFHYVSTANYNTDNDTLPAYKEGPIVTAPPSIDYQEGQQKFLFLDANPSKTAHVTEPDVASYNGGWLKVYFAEGGQPVDVNGYTQDNLYLYLAGNDPSNSGQSYAAFQTIGNQLLLNGVVVGTINNRAAPSVNSTIEWCGNTAYPLYITFNANATIATLDALVKNVIYINPSADPVPTTRVVSILACDAENERSIPTATRIDISSVNGTPWGSDFTANTAPNTPITITLRGYDSEPSSALTYDILLPLPTYGALGPIFNHNQVTYTPPSLGPDSSAVGVAYFKYSVTDLQHAVGYGSVTITIGPGAAPILSAGPDKFIYVNWGCDLAGLPDPMPAGQDATWSFVNGPTPPWIYPSASPHQADAYTDGFSLPGVYTMRLSLKSTSSQAVLGTDDVSITVMPNKGTTVDAGLDRLISSVSPDNAVTITGKILDFLGNDRTFYDADNHDTTWAHQWYLLSGPPGYSIQPGAGPRLILNNLPIGTYIFRLGTVWGGIASDEVTIRVANPYSHTWTRNVDFEQGYLGDVTYDEIGDALTISSEHRTLPFIDFLYYPAHLAEYAMVARVDIDSAQVVGNFRAAPMMGPSQPECSLWNGISDPSGDTWFVITREIGAANYPYAIRYGAVLGGVRGDRIGTAPHYSFRDNPFGEYLRPPFRYNSCIDRDGDGFLHVSLNGSQVFGWQHPEPLDGSYTAAEVLATADDETIKEIVNLDSSLAIASYVAAIDSNQNIWFAGASSYQSYSSGNLSSPTPLADGYLLEGIINRQNHLWAGGSQEFYDIDLSNSQHQQSIHHFDNPPLTALTKGMAIDRTSTPEGIWFITLEDHTKVFKLAPDGASATGYEHPVTGGQPKFLTIDGSGDIWVVIANPTTERDELYRMRNNGGVTNSVVGKVETGCLTTVDAIGLDWKGRLWLAGGGPDDVRKSRVIRVNPAAGPVGTGGVMIGAVEIDQALNLPLWPVVAFKNIAGSEPSLAVPSVGIWRTVHDAGASTTWGTLTWTSWEDSAHGATLAVKARAADTEIALGSTPWQTILTSGGSFPGTGQFVEIQVTFIKGMNGTTPVKPILYDLTLTPQGATPVIDEHLRQVVVDDSISLTKNARPVTIDVLANDSPNLSLVSVSPARRGGVAIANQEIVYTPPQGFSGIDRFVYKVTAAAGVVDYGLVTVNVSALETPPVAHHLDGTLAPSPNSPTWIAPLTGDKWAGSLAFSGSGNKKVAVADSPWLNVGHDMTVTFRIYKAADLAADSRIIGKGSSTVNESFGIWDMAGANHNLNFEYRTTDGQTVSIISDQTLGGNNTWQNIAITWSQGYAQFYFDGSPDGGFAPTPHAAAGIPIITTDPLTFGYPGFGADFNGRIDEVHIYNRALSNDEIYEIVNDPGLHVSSVGALVGRWSFDENSGSTAFDSSSANPIPDAPFIDPATASYSLWAQHFGAASVIQSVECKPPTPAGKAPIAANDFKTMTGRAIPTDNSELTIDVLANDSDPDAGAGDQIYLIDDFPRATTFGHVRKGTDNKLYYQPAVLSYGIDKFNYTIRDNAGGKSSATVTIYVAPVSPPRVTITLLNQTAVTPSTTLYTVSPTAAPVTVTITATAASGSVDTSAFKSDFFFGIATGRLFQTENPLEQIHPKIVLVEFFDGDRKIGEIYTGTTGNSGNAYTLSWPRVDAGMHYLTAVVTDALGMKSTSQVQVSGQWTDQIVQLQVDRPAAYVGNTPPDPKIIQFMSGFGALPAESAGFPDRAAGTSRPRSVTSLTPTLKISARDTDTKTANASYFSYQLLLFRSDKTFVANITPGTLVDGYNNGTLPWTTADPPSPQTISLDLRAFDTGNYELELRVNDGIDEERSVRYPFVLHAGLSLGQFAFQEEDYVVNTAGLPITITRSYDSSNPADGDFGVGWTFSLADLSVEFDESRINASDVNTDENFSMRAGGGRDVTLTLPDGRRTTFLFTMHDYTETGYSWLGLFNYQAGWVAEPGITAKLTTAAHIDGDFGDDIVYGLPAGLNYWQAGGPACPPDYYDIPSFILTLQDGTKYRIDRDNLTSEYMSVDTGDGAYIQVLPKGKAHVTSITKPNGEYFTIGSDSIDHYANNTKTRSLFFERKDGRVIAVRDSLTPDPTQPALVTYEYDGLGNLAYVNKLKDKTTKTCAKTTYLYEQPGFPHYITTVIDPRGLEIARNEYYSANDLPWTGKLKSIKAADGRITTMTYATTGLLAGSRSTDVSVASQTISDNEGNATKIESDGSGNVVLIVDAKNACVERWFNSYNDMEKEVRKPSYGAAGETTWFAYSYSDPGSPPVRMTSRTAKSNSGYCSREEYNTQGQLILSADANHYDVLPRNWPTDLQAQSLSGASQASFYTFYEYDASGNLLDVKAMAGPAGTLLVTLSRNQFVPNGTFQGLLDKTFDSLGNQTSYIYYGTGEQGGNFGDIKEITQYEGTSIKIAGTQFTYDTSNGTRLTQTAGDYSGPGNTFKAGPTTSSVYDARGRPITTTDGVGRVVKTTYDSSGRVASTTDAYGAATRNLYDANGMHTQIEYPDGSVARSVTYYGPEADPNKQLRHVVQENRHFPADAVSGTRTIYDELGHVIQTQVIKDFTISVTLNGEVCTTTLLNPTTVPIVSFTEAQYDFAGRITMSSTPRAQGSLPSAAFWTKTLYDPEGLKWLERRFVDSNGNKISGGVTISTAIKYDKNGNQSWIADPNRMAELTPDTNPTLPEPPGATTWRNQIFLTPQRLTQFTYDDFNRVTRTDLPNLTTPTPYTQTKYDSEGRKWLDIDADGKATAYIYAFGALAWVVTDVYPGISAPPTFSSVSDVDTWDWQGWARGGITQPVRDSTGTRYKYDALGSLTSQIDAENHTTAFVYNLARQRTKRVLPNGSAERVLYDIPIPSSDRWHREIHADFNGSAMLTEYDLSGRVTKKIPIVSASLAGGTASVAASVIFNPAGPNNALKFTAKTTGTAQNGITVAFVIDPRITGNPVVSYDTSAEIAVVRYSASNTAAQIRDAVMLAAADPNFPFNSALDLADSPNSGAGTIGTGPTADITAVTFTYDAGGRRTQMIDNFGTTDARTTKYAYDESGRLKVKQSPQGTVAYTYNLDGTVSEVTARHDYNFGTPNPQPALFSTTYLRSMWGRPSGAHMSYSYDTHNRLYQVSSATQDANHTPVLRTTYLYDAYGNLSSVQYANGVASTYSYNVRNALRCVRAVNAGVDVAYFDYDDYVTGDVTFPTDASFPTMTAGARTLSPAGVRRGLAEKIVSASGTKVRTIAYDYDGLNRLTAEKIRDGTGGTFAAFPTTAGTGDIIYDSAPGYADTAGYDKVGNRRSRAASAVPMIVASGPPNMSVQSGLAYDANDRMHSDGSNYDKNGNNLYQVTYTSQQVATSQIVPSVSTPDQYDLANRLIQRGAGALNVKYIYDGDGNRVIKTSLSSGVTTTTHYLVDTINATGYAQVLEEASTAGGAPIVSYVYGSDLISQDRSATVKYYGYDGQGSVRYLTSSAAPPTVTDTYTYDAFGILLSATGSTANTYRYTGEQWDPELGMYYLRARYYHPDIDRFWSMDVFEGTPTDPLSLHKYLYGHANPINMDDPSGLESRISVTTAYQAVGDGHHIIPFALWDEIGFDEPAMRFLDGATLSANDHNYTAHGRYTHEVRAEWERFLETAAGKNVRRPYTQATAEAFLKHVQKGENAFIKGFNAIVHGGPAAVKEFNDSIGKHIPVSPLKTRFFLNATKRLGKGLPYLKYLVAGVTYAAALQQARAAGDSEAVAQINALAEVVNPFPFNDRDIHDAGVRFRSGWWARHQSGWQENHFERWGVDVP